MTFEGSIRQVETARIDLKNVAGGAQGWADKQRQAFDSERMKPLDQAGGRLLAALQKAQEQCAKADRMLS